MVEIFHELDGELSILNDKTISIIGYGNQGRAQALNLRDSGLNVIVGNIKDDYWRIAINDNFSVFSITEATKKSDIIFLLLPDEVMNDVFEKKIKPNLKLESSLVFASGYNIGFKLLKPPENVDVLLIAPRMIGVGVRENFLKNEGFFSFIAIEQDFSGQAKKVLLALAKGIGTLKKGAIMLTFKQEAELDLFNEQAFGPAFGRVLLSSIYTLIDAGYPPEAVLIEMYMSNEMSFTYKKFAEIGLVKQVEFHSQTSQYGAMSRGIRFRKLPLKPKMAEILKEIQDGEFTKEWEKSITKLKFKMIKYFATKTKINQLEKQVRKSLKLKEYDIYEEEAPSEEEMAKLKSISNELKLFEQYYE
ncbi:MAG: ketol-acid reductoisomerase [Candidatus Lokiarchaeota archaeon]|nr:ketol-acid reductoisomerase [Candidatus Lokiarchaeota archaeon]